MEHADCSFRADMAAVQRASDGGEFEGDGLDLRVREAQMALCKGSEAARCGDA